MPRQRWCVRTTARARSTRGRRPCSAKGQPDEYLKCRVFLARSPRVWLRKEHFPLDPLVAMTAWPASQRRSSQSSTSATPATSTSAHVVDRERVQPLQHPAPSGPCRRATAGTTCTPCAANRSGTRSAKSSILVMPASSARFASSGICCRRSWNSSSAARSRADARSPERLAVRRVGIDDHVEQLRPWVTQGPGSSADLADRPDLVARPAGAVWLRIHDYVFIPHFRVQREAWSQISRHDHERTTRLMCTLCSTPTRPFVGPSRLLAGPGSSARTAHRSYGRWGSFPPTARCCWSRTAPFSA